MVTIAKMALTRPSLFELQFWEGISPNWFPQYQYQEANMEVF